ncbi:MAG: sugar ABC transporter ATP-binding protein [Acetivibrionales bacterium]
MSQFVLEMNNISKSFPGAKVLDDVSFKVKPGEVHALIGENGAGKSTLMKILMGIYTADSGKILMNGKPIVNRNPKEAMNHGIAMIHQELNPVLDMQVFENIFMGRELRTKFGLADKSTMKQKTQELFNGMNIKIPVLAYMRDLSVAQCQLVEIVKAISMHAKVVVMDEPTSAITEHEVDTLFEQINHLKARNVAVIYISHKLDEIFKICDRITVLRDGKHVGTDETKNFTNEDLIKMMVGRATADVFPKVTVPIGETILEVSNISMGKKVRNVSFALRKGEILGIAGLVGAGRSELVETIFGIRKKSQGTVKLAGEEIHIKHPLDAIKHKIALITEDRKFTGLNLIGTVIENISMVGLRKLAKFGVIDKKREKQVAKKYIDQLSIKTPNGNTLVNNLSGGNQQKVVISKWLYIDADVIIFDEPTRGIDVGAKHDIYVLIGEFVKQGKAVIIISSEIPEVMGLSDRIIVMAEGRITGELKREEFTQENIMTYATQFGEGGLTC